MVINSSTRPIILDFREQPVYEVGAQLAVLVSSPGKIARPIDRVHLRKILCIATLRERMNWDPFWAEQIQLIRPLYMAYKTNTFRRDMNTINRRLNERFEAAHVAIAYLKYIRTGARPTDLPKHIKRLSINELIKLHDQRKIKDVNNFRKRIWTPSLPVIHIAAAMKTTHKLFAMKGIEHEFLNRLIFDPDLIGHVVAEANNYKWMLQRSPFALKFKNLIDIQVARRGQ